uniref:Uncharacterized protein n=1 Tax=Curvibacter symbiont subsp. Hydra magnipapillata TaxID=667019 RepID=C9Y6P3_CURXX|nr:hypothetical protein Csp_E36200 [Curvibacter putative symbiont of Hydra magnipapillata]
MNTNFIFLFGGSQRGKTVVTSSIINFLSSVESEGQLVPFNVKKGSDAGNALFKKILWTFSQKIFPERTVLVENREPIYLNVRFTPNDNRDKEAINLTFLEMPGDVLQKIDVPEGGSGELPVSIDVFFKTIGTSISFILVTEHSRAAEDDQLMSSFIDHVRFQNKHFSSTRFLLLVTKWDDYDGGLPIDEFVKINMRLTHSKLHDTKHSISEFSIGEVGQVEDAASEPDPVTKKKPQKDFLKQYNPTPSRRVINWIYTNVTGKPLYQKSFFERILAKFLKFS